MFEHYIKNVQRHKCKALLFILSLRTSISRDQKVKCILICTQTVKGDWLPSACCYSLQHKTHNGH
jgi:uncharacterized cysteine cluster protein YcgN (CxxCxxCC family)